MPNVYIYTAFFVCFFVVLFIIVFCVSSGLVEKCIRFSPDSSLDFLYMCFKNFHFCIVPLWILVNLNYKDKIDKKTSKSATYEWLEKKQDYFSSYVTGKITWKRISTLKCFWTTLPAPVGMKGLLVNVKSDSNHNFKSLPVAVKKKLK